MKKILLVTLDFPPMRGGVAEYLYGLLSALPHDRVAVLADEAAKNPPAMYSIRRERLLGPKGIPLRWLRTIGLVTRAMREERADLLAVSHLLPMGTVALLLNIWKRVPYVVFVHGTDLHFAGRSAWKRYRARMILSRAALVVANSEYTRGLAITMGAVHASTEVVLPCPALGHSSLDDKTAAKNELGFAGKKVVLSVGRQVVRKGFDRMIRALSRLRQNCGDVVYLLIGDGPERLNLEKEALYATVKPFVFFRPSVPREKLHVYFGAADAFVLPAKEVSGDIEGFGIVLVEAQAHGLPIVTTRVGGIPEAVVENETALVLDERVDDAMLTDAVCRVLTDSALATRFGAAGRLRVRETFTWPKQAMMLVTRLKRL